MLFGEISLRSRIIMISLAPAMLMGLLITVIIGFRISVEMENQLKTNGEILGESIASAAEYAVKTKNTGDIERLICISVKLSKEVQFIEILDVDSKPMASCKKNPNYTYDPSMISVVTSIYGYQNDPKKISDDYDLEAPQLKIVIGHVRLYASHVSTKTRLIQLAFDLIWIFIVVTALGIMFSYLVSRNFFLAMKEMTDSAKKIGDGKFAHKFKNILPGEFGILQKSFLEMSETMENFTKKLESEVFLRTNDLRTQKILVEESHEEKKLLIRRSNQAIEHERRSIAFDLHDTLNTILLSVIGHARQTKSYLSKLSQPTFDSPIENLTAIETNASKLYALSRDLVSNLRPEVLDEFGLSEALDVLITFQNKADANCNYTYFSSPDFPKLNYDFNIVIYRIVQESLSNVMKHAQATKCYVDLKIKKEEDIYAISLTIQDNGLGFNPLLSTGRTGLVGMRERAEGISGKLSVASVGNAGTVITLITKTSVEFGDLGEDIAK